MSWVDTTVKNQQTLISMYQLNVIVNKSCKSIWIKYARRGITWQITKSLNISSFNYRSLRSKFIIIVVLKLVQNILYICMYKLQCAVWQDIIYVCNKIFTFMHSWLQCHLTLNKSQATIFAIVIWCDVKSLLLCSSEGNSLF